MIGIRSILFVAFIVFAVTYAVSAVEEPEEAGLLKGLGLHGPLFQCVNTTCNNIICAACLGGQCVSGVCRCNKPNCP